MSTNTLGIPPNEEKVEKKKKKLLPLFIFICLMLTISSCLVGYILGQKAVKTPIGQIIDTIVLDPNKENISSLKPIFVFGKASYIDGSSYANGSIDLHSQPKRTITDKKGYFFFSNVEEGEHTLFAVDENGKVLAKVLISIDQDASFFKLKLNKLSDGAYEIKVPLDLALLEIDIEIDQNKELIRINSKKLTAITYNGKILTLNNDTLTNENGAITTLGGAILLPDNSIIVKDKGVILSDGTFIENLEFASVITLPDGTTISLDGVVTYPDGSIDNINEAKLPEGFKVNEDGGINLSKNKTLMPDGTLILEDGTSISPDGDIEEHNYPITDTDGNLVSEKEKIFVDKIKSVLEPIIPSTDNKNVPDTDTPDTSGNTKIPDTPDIPDKLDTSDTSKVPDTSDKPDKPNITIPDNSSSSGGELPGGDGAGSSGGSSSQAWTKPVVYEKGGSWSQLTTINLFASSNSEVKDKIYPGVEGYYPFSIRNANDFALTFTMNITEDEHMTGNIPLKYRLLDNKTGKYLTGNGTDAWLSPEELQDMVVKIGNNRNVYYKLEWRWPYESGDDARDTAIGSADNLTHYINVKIYIEF